MHKTYRRRHASHERIFEKRFVKKSNSSLILSHVECYNYGNLRHNRSGYKNKKKWHVPQCIHANVEAQVLKTSANNGVEKHKPVFSALCQNGKIKRGGRNKKNDPLTYVMDLFVRQKGIKRIWVKKKEVKEKFPLPMWNQEEAQTGAKKKLERNYSIKTLPLKVWRKKEDDLLRGSRSCVSLQWRKRMASREVK